MPKPRSIIVASFEIFCNIILDIQKEHPISLPKTEAWKDSCARHFACTGRIENALCAWECTHLHALGAWFVKSCPMHFSQALGAWCLSSRLNLRFSVVFWSSSSNNLPRYFGNIIPPICKSSKASWIFILVSWIFRILQLFLICRFACFLRELLQEPPKIDIFREY